MIEIITKQCIRQDSGDIYLTEDRKSKKKMSNFILSIILLRDTVEHEYEEVNEKETKAGQTNDFS